MKTLLITLAVALGLAGALLGGGWLWVDHKFPDAEKRDSPASSIAARTDAILEHTETVLDPSLPADTVVERQGEDIEGVLEFEYLEDVVAGLEEELQQPVEPEAIEVEVQEAEPIVGRPRYLTPAEIEKIKIKKVDIPEEGADEPTPSEKVVAAPPSARVEEPNPPNRDRVLNRWIRKDDTVFLLIETPTLGKATIELFCEAGNVTIWGSHTGINLQQMVFDFDDAPKPLVLTARTKTFNRTIGHMIRGWEATVEYRGTQYKSVPYTITLEDFTNSTETLRRTCK